MVIAEHDRVEVVCELLRVDVPSELTETDPSVEDGRYELQEVALSLDELPADWPGPVIELDGRRDEEAAARRLLRSRPIEPAAEETAEPGLSAGKSQGGPDDGVHELCRGRLEDLDLERLLGAEVREEAALGEVQVLREPPDREPLEPDLSGEPRGVIEDRRSRRFSLPHGRIKARTFVSVKRAITPLPRSCSRPSTLNFNPSSDL